MADQQHQPELGISDETRLRGIALLAASRVHQRVSASSADASACSAEAVVRTATRFARFLATGE